MKENLVEKVHPVFQHRPQRQEHKEGRSKRSPTRFCMLDQQEYHREEDHNTRDQQNLLKSLPGVHPALHVGPEPVYCIWISGIQPKEHPVAVIEHIHHEQEGKKIHAPE